MEGLNTQFYGNGGAQRSELEAVWLRCLASCGVEKEVSEFSPQCIISDDAWEIVS